MNAENTLVIKEQKAKIHFSTYMLALFFVLLPFEYPMTAFGLGSILRYVGMLAMVFAVLDVFIDSGKIHFDYRCVLMALWLVFMFVSILWSEDIENYNRFSGMYLRNGLMFLCVCLVRYEKHELDLLCKAYVTGLALLLLYMTFVPGAVTYSDWQSRLTLAINDEDSLDQNYLAAIISLPFGLIFYDFINEKRQSWIRMAQLIACIACVYYVFATGSRTGILELALIAIFCFGADWKKNLSAIVIVVLLLFIFIPLLVESLPDDLAERYSLEAITGQTEESGTRLEIWGAALRAIVEGNWLFGYGAGSSKYVINLYLSSDVHVHNYYIALLLELGLVGFSLFTTMGVKMVREVFRSPYRKVAISFLGVLVTTLLLDVLTTKFFWSGMMLMAVAVSAAKTDKQGGNER